VTDSIAGLHAALGDRYRLERELGRGGMATVYLVRDLRHERLVALKVLHPELAATLGTERFLREIRTAARLQHPYILSVHDSGEAAGRLWFTMPYVEGESLRERLEREHQLAVADALRIAHEVARALDYAHRHNVIHRDIKPENILLTSDGDTLVTDFGIGRAIGAAAPDERLTETGVVVGTAAYMSPEQASGERDLDGRSDVYSLGVVLYEMLAGEAPFTGPTAQAIIARRFTETPRPLRPARETVPEKVEQVVMRALARLPADRPASAAAFAETLAAMMHTSGVVSSASKRGTPPVFRPRLGKKVVAGLLAALLAAAAVGTLLRSRTSTRPALDASLLAVAPFDVLDPKLALWREGMVDLLSRNLDGAGPLRTVSPTVVVRRWQGRADPQSAAGLGQRTGAGLALYGSLLSAGRDSVRLRATLYDVTRQSTLEEWELTEVVDRVDRLADSLTFRLLRGLGRTRPVGSVRSASFGSSSLPAVKAFLQGEQHLRRSEWDSALGYYERSIRLDSTFPLPLRRASIALGWIRTGFDTLSTAYALRAGAANHGLPPRDSLLVVSDSLIASMLATGGLGLRADSSWATQLGRLYATLNYATARYPDDPEAWNNLGEADNHFGAMNGRTYEDQLRAFDRAIALDSAYAPAYQHPIEVSARYGAGAMRRYLVPYLALQPRDVNANGLRVVARILDSLDAGAEVKALIGGLGADLFKVIGTLNRLPDSSEVILDLARFAASRPWPIPPLNDTIFARRQLARSLMSRGHLQGGYQAMAGADPGHSIVFAEAAILGGVPRESAAAAFKKRFSAPYLPSLAQAFPWWASQQDTTSLRLAGVRAESLAHVPHSARRTVARYVAGSAGAYLALARRDTARAIEKLLALSPDQCPACYLDRLTLAQLLAEQGKDQQAWQILRAEHPAATLFAWPSEVLWSLLRGRVGERIGERDRAVEAYTWVAGMWRNADPKLQPYVTEAREGLARLAGERK
jgi:serine/threonine-protein kinase